MSMKLKSKSIGHFVGDDPGGMWLITADGEPVAFVSRCDWTPDDLVNEMERAYPAKHVVLWRAGAMVRYSRLDERPEIRQ